MTLESIYYIGQTVAVIAILGTLIAVIYQLRQSNQTARIAATQAQIEGLLAMTRTIYETPGLAGILLSGNAGLDQLGPEQRLRYITFCVSSFRIWEGLHAQYIDGRIDSELWDMHVNELRVQRNFEGARQVWAFRGAMFSKDFQAFMATLETRSDVAGKMHDIEPALERKA